MRGHFRAALGVASSAALLAASACAGSDSATPQVAQLGLSDPFATLEADPGCELELGARLDLHRFGTGGLGAQIASDAGVLSGGTFNFTVGGFDAGPHRARIFFEATRDGATVLVGGLESETFPLPPAETPLRLSGALLSTGAEAATLGLDATAFDGDSDARSNLEELLRCADHTDPTDTPNRAPLADIALMPDQEIYDAGDSIVASGSASFDPDGDDLSYEWSLEAAPEGAPALEGAQLGGERVTYASMVPGAYTLRLVVTDSFGVRSRPARRELTVRAGERPELGLELGLSEDRSPILRGEVELEMTVLDGEGAPVLEGVSVELRARGRIDGAEENRQLGIVTQMPLRFALDTDPWDEGALVIVGVPEKSGAFGEAVELTLTVDRTAPVVSIVEPVADALWQTAGRVAWTAVDPHRESVSVRFAERAGASWTDILVDEPFIEETSVAAIALENSAAAIVEVQVTDIAGNVGSATSAPFTVDSRAPAVTLISPVGGEIWDGTRPVRWETTDLRPATVKIELLDGASDTPVATLAPLAPDTGTWQWDTTQTDEGKRYRLRVTATDAGGLEGSGTSPEAFAVNRRPQVTLLSPVDARPRRGDIVINWRTDDGNPERARIEVQRSHGGLWQPIATQQDTPPFTWDSRNLNDTQTARLRVVAIDTCGVESDTSQIDAAHSPQFAVDNTPPVGTLIAPAPSALWTGTRSIEWRHADANGTEAWLEFSADDGALWTPLNSNALPGTGTFEWDTTPWPDSPRCRLRLRLRDEAGNESELQSERFSLDNATPPQSRWLLPVGGEIWSGEQSLRWETVEDHPGTVRIEISADGQSWDALPEMPTADDGEYVWDTRSGVDLDEAWLRLTPTDAAGNVGRSVEIAAPIAVDNTAPVIELLAPDAGAVVRGASELRWITRDAHPESMTVSLQAGPGQDFVAFLLEVGADTGTTDYDSRSFEERGDYSLRLLAMDAAGNEGVLVTAATHFAIDNTAPRITSISAPAGGTVIGGPTTLVWTTEDVHPGEVTVALELGGVEVAQQVFADTGTAVMDLRGHGDSASAVLRLVPEDLAGNVGNATRSATLVLDDTPPVVTVLEPAVFAVWSGLRTVSWQTTDAHPGTVDILYSLNAGPEVVLQAGAPDNGSFALQTTVIPESEVVRFFVRATDEVGFASTTASSAGIVAVDNTAPTVAPQSPADGSHLKEEVVLRWITQDAHPGLVNIRAVGPGGQSVNIASDVADRGLVSWNTVSVVDGAWDLHIEVCDGGGLCSGERPFASFQVDNTAPALQLLAPVAGDLWTGSEMLRWDASDASTLSLRLEYQRSPGEAFEEVLPNIVDDGEELISTSGTLGVDDVDAQLRLTATDRAGNSTSVLSGAFDVDNASPQVSLDAPAADSILTGTVAIRWTTTDSHPARAVVFQSLGNSAEYAAIYDGPDTGEFDWMTTALPDRGPVVIRVEVEDAVGRTRIAQASMRGIDNLEPRVTLSEPTDGSFLGSTARFQWSVTEATPALTELYWAPHDDLGNWTLLETALDTSGVRNFSLASVPERQVVFELRTRSEANRSASVRTGTMVVDRTAPTVNITAPIASDRLSDVADIRWTTHDANPGTVDVLAQRGAAAPIVVAQGIDDGGQFDWTIPAAWTEDVTIQVRARDLAGNVGPLDTVGPIDLARGPPAPVHFRFQGGEVATVNWDETRPGAADVTGYIVRWNDENDGPPWENESAVGVGERSFELPGSDNCEDFVVEVVAIDANGAESAPEPPQRGHAGSDCGANYFFADPRDRAAGNSVELVAVGDLNGDGIDDIAAGGDGDSEIVLLRSLGNRSFQAVRRIAAGSTRVQDLALSDVDNDGDLDVAVLTSTRARFWRNPRNESSSFISGTSVGLSSSPHAFAVGHLDSDAYADMAIARSGATSIRVLLGDSSGGLRSGTTTVSVGRAVRDLAIADVDDDGAPDLVLSTADGLFLLYGAGDGHGNGLFLGPAVRAGNSSADMITALALDITNDGVPELFAISEDTNRMYTLASGLDAEGRPTRSSVTSETLLFDRFDPSAAVAAHFDSDPHPDIFVLHHDAGSASKLQGQSGLAPATASPALLSSYSVGVSPDSVAAGDFDADGKTDVAIAFGLSDVVQVQFNIGEAVSPRLAFDAPHLVAGDFTPSVVKAADINNDGFPDLVFGTGAAVRSRLAQPDQGRNADLSFGATRQQSHLGTSVEIVVADFDGDGVRDVVTAGNSGVDALAGTGTRWSAVGAFAAAAEVDGGALTTVAVADLNDDHIPDLVVKPAGSGLWRRLGQGDGSFGTLRHIYTSSQAKALVTTDFDFDGIVDIVATRAEGGFDVHIGSGSDGVGNAFYTRTTSNVICDAEDLVVSQHFGRSQIIAACSDTLIRAYLQQSIGGEPTARVTSSTLRVLDFDSVASDLHLANLDREPLPELVVALPDEEAVAIVDMPSFGAGLGLELVGLYPTGGRPVSVDSADFNTDGVPDLVVVNEDGLRGVILLGMAEID